MYGRFVELIMIAFKLLSNVMHVSRFLYHSCRLFQADRPFFAFVVTDRKQGQGLKFGSRFLMFIVIIMTSPRYILLGPAWTRAFRCVWMLEEIGASYKVEDAMPLSKRVRELAYSGKVPILLDYGTSEKTPFVLYESTAINTYIGEGTSLVPEAGSLKRALYDQTISCLATELDAQGLWLHRKHAAMSQFFGDIPDAVDAAKAQFTRMNQQLAQQLNPFLLGESFTAADIMYVHCLDWSKSIGWHSDWPDELDSYRSMCHKRPAYQRAKALRDEGQDQRRQNSKL